MTFVDIPLDLSSLAKNSPELNVINETIACRKAAEELIAENRTIDALERTVAGLRTLKGFPDFENLQFKSLLAALLFDLSEIHFQLKDYKQSEKELDVLFRLLDGLIKEDADKFGPFHILAMELSTRILRSRKKAMDLLVKHQINAGQLYEKVNSGVVAATDKLVDSLRNVGQLLASSGDYKAAMKFYAEAIKFSKKRSGRVTRKEIQMTIEMAEIMIRVRHMRPRARRLLNAILPHAISLETIKLEEDILALVEIIDSDVEQEPKWKAYLHKLTAAAKSRLKKKDASKEEEAEETNLEEEAAKDAADAAADIIDEITEADEKLQEENPSDK